MLRKDSVNNADYMLSPISDSTGKTKLGLATGMLQGLSAIWDESILY